jgi:hypothetical protein
MDMVAYFYRTIMKARAISLEAGQAKYRAIFISTTDYLEFKADVDTALKVDGLGDCIVTA